MQNTAFMDSPIGRLTLCSDGAGLTGGALCAAGSGHFATCLEFGAARTGGAGRLRSGSGLLVAARLRRMAVSPRAEGRHFAGLFGGGSILLCAGSTFLLAGKGLLLLFGSLCLLLVSSGRAGSRRSAAGCGAALCPLGSGSAGIRFTDGDAFWQRRLGRCGSGAFPRMAFRRRRCVLRRTVLAEGVHQSSGPLFRG